MFQTQINETDVSRVKKLEDEIYHINSDLKKTERRYEVNMINETDGSRVKKLEDEIYHINTRGVSYLFEQILKCRNSFIFRYIG